MIKIAIVDDHEIFLKGLEGLINQETHFVVVNTFDNGKSLLQHIENLEIDILLLDLQLPDTNYIHLLRDIRNLKPNLKIIYLTLLRGNKYFNNLSPYGFEGYLLKDSPFEILKMAIETVYSGETFYGDRYSDQEDKNTVTLPDSKALSILSKREIEVLKLVAQEHSSSQIAEKLFVSVSTVDSHRKNIMLKLGVDNIVGLIKIAVKNNLI